MALIFQIVSAAAAEKGGVLFQKEKMITNQHPEHWWCGFFSCLSWEEMMMS